MRQERALGVRGQAKARMVIDMTAHCLEIGGAALIADGCGALYWPEHATLLVADLHLEKAAHFAGRGSFLPPYDTRETLARLGDAIARYRPRRVVALGDSFHSTEGPRQIGRSDLATLSALQAGREWIWITGNHDPDIARRVGGAVMGTLELGGIVLRHEPSAAGDDLEIAGHLHPAARLVRDGYCLRRPCFVSNRRRAVMPAFGAFTGGLNVLDAAFAPVFGTAATLGVLMLGTEGIYPVPLRHLAAD